MMFDEDEGGGLDFGVIAQKIVSLLPVLMLGMLIMGLMLFAVSSIVPQIQAYADLNANVQGARAAVTAQAPDPDAATILGAQLEGAVSARDQAAARFATDTQADGILDTLYRYADEQGVTIVTLRTQQNLDEDPSGPYALRSFRLQVDGALRELMAFVVGLREASVPAVQVGAVSINPADAAQMYSLMLDLRLSTSPYASGAVFADLPHLAVPVPPTPNPADAESTALAAAATPNLALTATALFAPTATPPLDGCAGAPPNRIRVGQTAVVDFNTPSALNILAVPRTVDSDIDIIAQARDGALLEIIGGPVCGRWKGMDVWYWQVIYGGVQGWAGEASAEERWVCPPDEPECAE